jgi:vacuolar-type H+-ATPase catalytic subunit A/Vma1
MWINIIFNVALSIITIFIAHQLWEYCKINYTSQKTKNLVEIHASKYKQIAEDMERNMTPDVTANETKNYKIEPTDTKIFLPPNEKEWIHKELTSFIDTL